MIRISVGGEQPLHRETGRPWYDTRAGIAGAIKTLEGFNRLIHARNAAGYDRDERLNVFYVLGRYYLDACGNCGKAQGSVPKVILPDIPDVLTQDEFREHLKGQPSADLCISFSMDGCGVPPVGLLCSHCNVAWGDDNFHDTVTYHATEVISLADFVGRTLGEVKSAYAEKRDAIYRTQSDIIVRNDKYIDHSPKYPNPKEEWERSIEKNEHGWLSEMDGITDSYIIQEGDELFINVWRFFHGECNRRYRHTREESRFRELFLGAGFQVENMISLPNEYCPCEFCAPWFNVVTDFGTIKIGWRKRVINIDWSNLHPRYRKWHIISIFEEEDVTKGHSSIHAWGMEKAGEYLKRLREHVSAPI